MATKLHVSFHVQSSKQSMRQKKRCVYCELILRPSNDDVDVLKQELISVQQRMNNMSLEKEDEIERLRAQLQHKYTHEYSSMISIQRINEQHVMRLFSSLSISSSFINQLYVHTTI
jgi:hypothetical protein